MVFWFADTSQVDLLFGRAFGTELDLPNTAILLALVDAAIAGQLTEKIWTIFRKTIYSKSEVITKHGKVTVRHGIPFLYPFWLRHDHSYSPYVPVSLRRSE